MISPKEMEDYDNTPLMFEETMEMYYLDSVDKIGKLLPLDKQHETNLEEIIPEDFLYYVDSSVLDSNSYEWKLTYQFSSSFRDPFRQGKGQYGNPNLTFRRLYVILCYHFNDSYFIDDYFEKVYPSTMKDIVEARLEGTKKAFLELVEEAGIETRITKGNKLDLRYRINRELTDWSDTIAEEEANYLAQLVKEDIKECLSSGRIPLNFTLSATTLAIREKLGIESFEPFYATGQLIDDLKIFFNLEKKGWQTKQGIMV